MAQATKDLGLSQREVLDFTERLNPTIIVSGASSSHAMVSVTRRRFSSASSWGRAGSGGGAAPSANSGAASAISR